MTFRLPAVLVVVGSLAGSGTVFAKCDTLANANALRDARTAIDDACPCAAATSAGAHGKCAKGVVNDRVEMQMLAKTCRGEALNHAKKSVCGRPGAVVCCRVKPSTGKTSHKIASAPEKCTSTPSMNACVSVFPTIDTGCDAMGCVQPVCGNGAVEPTETCDPPRTDVCDASCQLVTCEPPVGACGNGTVDAGETCEPPGGGACGWDCQATACAAAGAGEIDVACVSGAAAVAAGSRSGDYLVAWTGIAYRNHEDVVARRLDGDGNPLASPRVASQGVPCSYTLTYPSAGGDGGRYMVAWQGSGALVEGPVSLTISARSYENDDTVGALDDIIRTYPAGMCQDNTVGPTAIAPMTVAGPDAFAVLWRNIYGCFFGGVAVTPDGVFYDGAPSAATRSDLAIHYSSVPPPAQTGQGGASTASTASDTLVAWHAATWTGGAPTNLTDTKVQGAWLAADGTSTGFTVSTRQPAIGRLRPAVAAASDRLLVAWAEGAGTDPTEVRAMRVTKPGGPLDADGGILLATAADKVTGGPAAAFDGTVWLVAWSESAVGGDELRAVAVQTDGTVVDATPRLLATGLASSVGPAAASAGDGRSLVVYVKADAALRAIRAQLVPGS